MPQNPNVIATKTVMGPVYVFDRTRHPSEPNMNMGCIPDIRLTGHTKEGYGLSWSKKEEGHVISASEDSTVCYWDIKATTKEHSELEPLRVFSGHSAWVEDVSWHEIHPCIFSSVGDDKKMMMYVSECRIIQRYDHHYY